MRLSAAQPAVKVNATTGQFSGNVVQNSDGTATSGRDAQFGCPNPPPPHPKWVGGMAYINWFFGLSPSQVQVTVNFQNFPGKTSDEFFQAYDAPIDGTGQYFGVQTPGMAIFSRFGTNDTSNVRTGNANATVVAGTEYCAAFVSLRWPNFGIGTGRYIMTIRRAESDGTNDWFNYYIARPGDTGIGAYIGAIRFPRSTPSVAATFGDGGGSWTEFWDNNNTTQEFPVPDWFLNIPLPLANQTIKPQSAQSHYSIMPQSDVSYDKANQQFIMNIGQDVTRTHPAATYTLP